jgi:hypothetical protein
MSETNQAESRKKVFKFCAYLALSVVVSVLIFLVLRSVFLWWKSHPATAEITTSSSTSTHQQKTIDAPPTQQMPTQYDHTDNSETKQLIPALEKESEEISLQYGSKSVSSITPVAHTVFLTVPALYARSVDEPPIPEANSADEDDATTRLRRVGVISRPAPTQWTAWVYTPTGYRIDRVAYPPDTENLFTEVLYEDGGRHVFFGNGSSSAPLKKKSAARRFCNVGGYPVTITIFFSQQK